MRTGRKRQRDGSGSELRRRGAASAQLATTLRHELVRWAGELSVPAAVANDIGLAGYEAMVNTVLHAYPRGTLGVLQLHARIAHQVLTVTVTDRGCWGGESAGSHPGMGLSLIRELPERAEISTGDHGTTVSMTWHSNAT